MIIELNEFNVFRVLQVNLKVDEVSSAGFSALSTLPHLDEFLFGDRMNKESDWVHESKFLILCSRFLPKLSVSGRRFDFLHVDFLYESTFRQYCGYHKEMVQEMQQPAKLSLQHLNLSNGVQPNENIQFPQLETLSLWFPNAGQALSLCQRFQTVSALGLYDLETSLDLLPTLQSVGQRLHSLVLDEASEPAFSLLQVLESCPNLKHFRLSNCTFLVDPPEQWPEKYFSGMEEVFLCSLYSPPAGFIMQVNKKTCNLRGANLTKEFLLSVKNYRTKLVVSSQIKES